MMRSADVSRPLPYTAFCPQENVCLARLRVDPGVPGLLCWQRGEQVL